MADFSAPSFSLGLDLDFDDPPPPPPPPNQESHSRESPGPTTTTTIDLISSQSIEADDGDEDFEPETLVLDRQVEEPCSPPILKRLKRGPPPPPTRSLPINKPDPINLSVDDEIDDISSPDDNRRDEPSATQNRSARISSNSSQHGSMRLRTQLASKSKAKQSTQASNSSVFTSSINTTFPQLTISPVRKFQLLDSDSDDSFSSEGLSEDAKADVPASKRQCCTNQNPNANKQKGVKTTGSKLQTEDLWKDFGPQEVNIPTPALDEFCEEYFKSVKDKNVDQTKDEDVYVIHPKVNGQKNGIRGNTETKDMHKELPPAYKYYYHDDPRIRKLVCHRLPNFSPLGVSKTEMPPSQAADIDYMCQFAPSERTSRKQNLEGSSRTGRKNLKQSNCDDLPEVSGSWVNPKGRNSMLKNAGKSQGPLGVCSSVGPKNAGKRRVRADSRSSGSWYTGEDGRKVYVTKNGQELTGQIAYRHYKKESGSGFKKSRKKAASKKKSKR